MTYSPQYALFYDFHTSPVLKGIGSKFDAEAFAARLERMKVDFVSFPARCNMGMAYYDTKIGIRHYGLDFDLFGTLAEACHRHGIAVNAYFNGGISQEEGRLHPDWQARPTNPPTPAMVSPYYRTMCGNTPYREHLIAMMTEVAERYPIAGFFIDCMAGRSCRCEYCLDKMRAEGIDSSDEAAVTAFALRRNREFAAAISKAIKKINPEYLLYFNGIGYEDQLELGTYLDFECIPTKEDCDYEYLPLMSRYMRTLGERPRLNMTGRFYLWGDFGGLRSEKAIRQELLTGLSNGMRPNIGDHMPPDCQVPERVMSQNERIFAYLQEREPFFQDATPQADMAILFPKSHQEIYEAPELRAALRMLSELHCQFDIVTLAADWSKYRLLVLPDTVTLTAEAAERVRNYLRAGGKIISSGDSGRLQDGGGFLPEWGVADVEGQLFQPAYFLDKDGMKVSVYSKGRLLSPKAGTAMVYPLVRPLLEHVWDGRYAEYYNPPGDATEYPFLTRNLMVAHFSCRIFTGYQKYAATTLRDVMKETLAAMLPDPILKTDGLPQYVRITMTAQKSGRQMVHLLAHIPQRRAGNCEIIEDDLTVLPARLSVKTSATQAFQEPEHLPLACRRVGEYLEIDLPQFTGYLLLSLTRD